MWGSKRKPVENIPDKKVYVRRDHKYSKGRRDRFSVSRSKFIICFYCADFLDCFLYGIDYTSRLFPLHERGFLLPEAVKTEMEFLRDFIFIILSQVEISPSSRKSTTLSLCLPVFLSFVSWAYKDLKIVVCDYYK